MTVRRTLRIAALAAAALAPLGCISPLMKAERTDDPLLRTAYECDLAVRKNPYLGVAAPGFLVAEHLEDKCIKARGAEPRRANLFE